MKKTLFILVLLLLLLTACADPNQKFINKLIEETNAEDLNWDTIFKVTHQYDIDNFNYILSQNEFHSIEELESFGIATQDGISILLLNESFESGKDGSISKEKNLYIVKGVGDQVYKLPAKEKDLVNLETAVKNYVDKIYLENHVFDGPENYKINDLYDKSFDDLIKEYINRKWNIKRIYDW